MKRLLHIIGVFVLLVFVSSCAKDELEAPASESDGVRAIDMGSLQTEKDKSNALKDESATYREDSTDGSLDINDDDDEEDENRNPDKGQ